MGAGEKDSTYIKHLLFIVSVIVSDDFVAMDRQSECPCLCLCLYPWYYNPNIVSLFLVYHCLCFCLYFMSMSLFHYQFLSLFCYCISFSVDPISNVVGSSISVVFCHIMGPLLIFRLNFLSLSLILLKPF